MSCRHGISIESKMSGPNALGTPRSAEINYLADRSSWLGRATQITIPEEEGKKENKDNTGWKDARLSPQSLPSQSSRSSDHSHSAFRASFKYYKRRDPPPDLSQVLNPRLHPSSSLSFSAHSYPPSDSVLSFLGLRPFSEWKVITFPDRDGLFLLPDLLRPCCHIPWIRRTLQYAKAPNTTNLSLHSPSPFSLLDNPRSLRWVTLGIQYDWTTKEYPLHGHSLPEELSLLAENVSNALGLGRMRADAAIVNYYPQKSTLSPHVDRSERILSVPLISLSLGCPAIYLTGGKTLDEDPLPLLLQSGDVLVMHGEQRLVHHAVPTIVSPTKYERGKVEEGEEEGLLKGKDEGEDMGVLRGEREVTQGEAWESALKDFSRTNRVNITIRQVNP